MAQNKSFQKIMRQYALTGAALGLYFGWFFRPVREPSLWIVIGLSVLVTIVITILRLVRKDRPSLSKLAQNAGLIFVKYAVALSVLEGRHFAFDWGGKVAVIIMTTIMGALAGVWYAYEQTRKEG